MKLQSIRYDLAAGTTHARELHRETHVLHCLDGRLWVTLESEPRDFVLRAGDSLVVHGPGRLVALAIDAASFELASASRITHLAA